MILLSFDRYVLKRRAETYFEPLYSTTQGL